MFLSAEMSCRPAVGMRRLSRRQSRTRSCDTLFDPHVVTDEDFAELLRHSENLIVLDLRSFLLFKKSHLKQAINVSLPCTLAKRKSFTLHTVETNIDCSSGKETFRHRAGKDIILIDSISFCIDDNPILSAIWTKLHEEGVARSVRCLAGGYDSFIKKFPEFSAPVQRDGPLRLNQPYRSPHQILSGGRSIDPRSPGRGDHMNVPIQVIDNLYIGDAFIASNLQILDQCGITHILNAANECPNYLEHVPTIKYHKIGLVDTPSEECMLETFTSAISFIDDAIQSGGRVLVHCLAGKSRSATIAIAFLILKTGRTLEAAYNLLQERRPAISPNLGFMGVLMNLQQHMASLNDAEDSLFESPSLALIDSVSSLIGETHSVDSDISASSSLSQLSARAANPQSCSTDLIVRRENSHLSSLQLT